MKKNKKPANTPCRVNRILTRKEKETIIMYNVHPKVEERIVADWKSREHPRVTEKMKEKRSWTLILSNIVTYLLPFLLWSSYLDPKDTFLLSVFGEDGVYVADIIMQTGIILSWTLVVLGPMFLIAYIGMKKMARYDPWNPTYLAMWKGESLSIRIFRVLWRLIVVSGAFLNGFIVLSVCMIVAYLMMYLGLRSVRNVVKTAMYPY
jgi:hypothetical protein